MQVEELAKLLGSDGCPTIVDVRTGLEYRAGHIPGALHLPIWALLLPGNRPLKDVEKPIVLTCEHGPRARIARSLLRKRGYRRVSLLEGHMLTWRRNGLPIQKNC